MPKTLFFIIPSYAVFLLIGIVMLKKKNRYAVPFIFVILMGLIQFPMPYIGNGAADISKQLFLFNISFDFGLTVLIYMLFKTVSKNYQKISKTVDKPYFPCYNNKAVKKCGSGSVVERHLAKVNVASSNLVFRFHLSSDFIGAFSYC